MERTWQKYYIDVGMTSSFLLCLGTGIAKFAPVTRFLGLKSAVIAPMTLVHDWSGIAFGLCALVHLAFNWKWMVGMTKKFSSPSAAKPVPATGSPATSGVTRE
jgi:hypothetical protein